MRNRYLLLVVLMSVLLSSMFCGCSSVKSEDSVNQQNEQVTENGKDSYSIEKLTGFWVYDSTTSYEFKDDYTGAMYVNEEKYAYTFKIKGTDLAIDFKDEALYDCIYGFKVEGNSLTIEGKKGTSGGTYQLEKKDF